MSFLQRSMINQKSVSQNLAPTVKSATSCNAKNPPQYIWRQHFTFKKKIVWYTVGHVLGRDYHCALGIIKTNLTSLRYPHHVDAEIIKKNYRDKQAARFTLPEQTRKLTSTCICQIKESSNLCKLGRCSVSPKIKHPGPIFRLFVGHIQSVHAKQ